MSKYISPDSVRSGRTCLANLCVQSCPVRKLICPVRSSPTSHNIVDKTFLSLVAHSNPCVILHCSVRDFVNGSLQATYLEEERENR